MRRRLAVLALTLAAICAGSLVAVDLAAAAPTGSISGRVTNSSGAGVANAVVLVYADGAVAASTTTGPDGSYTIGALANASYTVNFRPPSVSSGPDTANYLPQNYSGKSPSAGADPVTVQAGEPRTGIDAVLQPGGTVSGSVVDGAGAPVAGIVVSVYDAEGVGVGMSATTGSDGTYAIDRLPTGEYTVSFLNEVQTPTYVPDYFGGSQTLAGSYGVAVTAGSTTSGIDAHLLTGGRVTGTVTDAAGAPIAGVGVEIYDSSGNRVGSTVGTGADGTFALTGLASGSYKVGFWALGDGPPGSPPPNYLPQYYDAASNLEAGTVVKVTAGDTTSGIGAQLAAGGEIDGLVTDAGDSPLAGIDVTAYAGDGTVAAFTTTGSDGTYAIPALPSGSYKLYFNPESVFASHNYVAQFYGGSTLAGATAVPVTAGTPPAVANAQLAPGATISGTVTDSLGAPLADVPVVAYDATGDVVGASGTSAHFTGNYQITGLPAGIYRIGFDQGCCGPGGNYSPQFSGAQPSLASAATVTVGPAGSATGVNAALAPGGEISGRVTDTAGVPLEGLDIEAIDAAGTVVALTESGADGTYDLRGLASAGYRVQYAGSFAVASPLIVTQYYGGSTTLAGAVAVPVTAGAETTGIDMKLAHATGSLAGTVTDGDGDPLAGASVTLYNLDGDAVPGGVTGSDGSFAVSGIDPGFYRVGFALAAYAPQYFPGASSLTAAPLIYVASNGSATGIDAQLTATEVGTQPTVGQSITPPSTSTNSPLPALPAVEQTPPPAQGKPASVIEMIVLPPAAKVKLSPRHALSIPVRCLATAPCKGHLTLSVVRGEATRNAGSGSVSIAPGTRGDAKVTLNATGVRLFRSSRGRLRVTVTISVTGAGTKQTLRESVLIV